MKSLKMRWPGLNCEVLCDGIAENQAILDVLMENTPPTGGDVRKMNARGVQKVNIRSDSEQKMRCREKLQKIFSANISLNISVIYSCEKKNTPAGPLFVP